MSTPLWTAFPFDNRIMSQLGKITCILMEPRGPSAWFTRTCQWSLFWVTWICPPPLHHRFKVNFNLSFYLPLLLPSGFLRYFYGIHNSSDFPIKTLYELLFSPVLVVCPRPPRRTSFPLITVVSHASKFRWTAQIMKPPPPSVLCTVSSCRFFPARSTYSSTRLSSTFSVCSSFTAKIPAGKIAVLHILIFAFSVSHLDGKMYKTESSRGFPHVVPAR